MNKCNYIKRNIIKNGCTKSSKWTIHVTISSTTTTSFMDKVRLPKSHYSSYPISKHFSSATNKTYLKQPPLPIQFLKNACSSNYDPTTYQRNNIPCNPITGEKLIKVDDDDYYKYNSIWIEEDEKGKFLKIEWKDDGKSQSKFDYNWISLISNEYKKEQDSTGGSTSKSMYYPYFLNNTASKSNNNVNRVPWDNLSSSYIRDNLSIPFTSIINAQSKEKENATKKVLQHLYQHGVVLIKNTPIDDRGQGISAFASCVSGGGIKDTNSMSSYMNYYTNHVMNNREKQLDNDPCVLLQHGTDGPMRTLYGSIWTTQSNILMDNSSIADSAYTTDALPLHTDMTYMNSPPGLQLFCMVQPALKSNTTGNGESVYGDGYAMVNHLQTYYPDIYSTFTTLKRRYRCIDTSNGWFLETFQPMIHASNGNFVALRHNDLDRLPDLLVGNDNNGISYEDLDDMHAVWDGIVNDDKFRVCIDLQPGEMMVIANQRCMHGRFSFQLSTLPRTIMGCYVSQEELNSRFRWEGYRVHL